MAEPVPMMCMLPFVDSMNHRGDGTENVLWKPKLVRGHFIMTIKRDVAAGEELTAQYHKPPVVYEQQDYDPHMGEGPLAVRAANSKKKAEFEHMRNFIMYGFCDTSDFDHIIAKACKASK